ncbi:MAG: MarR family transcriptional regulator [Alphaproteobacteria bacterium]|nr:MarR family transcriptional regulator [Alphaproteobacteria bacterium]MBL7100022.1 MarR family transcriptional regulator [Alphaproteobacteria bacterium]
MQQNLDRDLLIVLNDVARNMRTRFDQLARSTYAMTRAQWIILARLERQPGMSQNEMAAICEVEPITVARLVDRLESRGMVERRADPNDRRIRRLYLLPAAKPIVEIITKSREDMNARLIALLDQKTYDGLVDALLRIKENLANEPLTGDALAEAGE